MLIRLNKFLSDAGKASRRQADKMIAGGRVSVNGQVIQEMGYKIDAQKDRVAVDGREVLRETALIYMMLNKPRGYLVTMKDAFGRPTVNDLLPALKMRVFPVGRLDLESEGLLLLTNDGELAFRLMHPRYKVKKTYMLNVKGVPEPSSLSRLQKGIYLDGCRRAPEKVVLLESTQGRSIFRVEMHEGRKREVRRMFELLGHTVLSLKRVGFAGLTLGNLRSGKWRFLKHEEIKRLKKTAGLA